AGTVAGTVAIEVRDGTAALMDRSPETNQKSDLLAWTSLLVVCTSAGTGGLPKVVAAAAMAGGHDDRANVAAGDWKKALDRLDSAFGPGQVSAPGRTDTTTWGQLWAHGAAQGRVALLDAVDTTAAATLLSAAAGLASDVNARYGALMAPWGVAPGL